MDKVCSDLRIYEVGRNMMRVAVANETPPRYKRLGQLIGDGRRARRLTQDELAAGARISKAYVGHLEGGRRRADPDVLRRIARALGLPPAELLEAAGYKDAPEYDQIPSSVLAVVRRLVNQGYGADFFAFAERVGSELFLNPPTLPRRKVADDEGTQERGVDSPN